MPKARGNLTGFPELYSSGQSDLKIFLFFSLHYKLFETNQNKEKTLSILMGLKVGDFVRKAEVKIKQCENPLKAVYANCETCQIPSCLSHELIETKIE